jgi:hypothetical protein
MKKKNSVLITILVALTFYLIMPNTLYASEATSYLAFIDATTNYTALIRAKKPGEEIKAAQNKMIAAGEKYIRKYEDKVPVNTSIILQNLVLVFYNLKKHDKVIYYGEKLAKKPGLKDIQKASLFLFLADSYISTGKDYKRGSDFADGIKLIATNNISTTTGLQKKRWQNLLGQALRFKGNVFYIKKDYDNAVSNFIESYKNYPSKRTLKTIREIGRKYFKQKQYKKALSVFEFSYQALSKISSKRAQECLKLLARTYSKLGMTDKAIQTFSKLYSKRKNAELAYRIGALYNKKFKISGGKDKSFLEKAKLYWAESVVLKSPQLYAKQAEKILKNYMIKMEKATLQEYEDILKVAKKRLGLI